VTSACSDAGLDDAGEQSSEQTGDTTGQASSDTVDAEVDLSLPTQPNEPEVVERNDGWLEIRPGGDTSCSRGTDYAYFVRPGDPEKVVVEFQGGGACWDDLTCSVAGAIFIEDIENTRYLAGDYREGIYDHANPDNPFAGWTHVFIPYCTGDVHWGNAVKEYGSGNNKFTINHKGFINAASAIGWIERNLEAPEKITVTGCSAGGYGSIVWSAWLMEKYPESQVLQFSDSAAGIITDAFFADSFPSWGVDQAFPTWIPELDLNRIDYLDLDLDDVYQIIGNRYPNQVISQYNTIMDKTQIYYYEAMSGGGGRDAWTQGMTSSINRILENTDNFKTFIASGEEHCAIINERFYTAEANGMRLVDWLRDMVRDDDDDVDNIYCDECEGFEE